MQLPENINIEQSDKYILSIRITSTVFFFCIYQADTKEIVCLEEISFLSENNGFDEIQRIIFDSEFLTYPYQETNVIFVSKDYDLAPQYLIQKDKKEALYNFTHIETAKQILYCSETIQQIVTVYNTDEEIYQFLARNLFNPEFHHHSNIMMQYLEEKNKVSEKTAKMYMNFHDEFIDVFCYSEQSQVLHVLTFEDENEKSMVYHILNIWDKCGFDQNLTPLYILNGYGIPNMYITTKLKEYIRNVQSLSIDEDINTIKKRELDMPLPLDFLIQNAR